MSDQSIGELEAVEYAGEEEEPSADNQPAPPPKERESPTASLTMPLERVIVGRNQREPGHDASQAQPLCEQAMTDIGAPRSPHRTASAKRANHASRRTRDPFCFRCVSPRGTARRIKTTPREDS